MKRKQIDPNKYELVRLNDRLHNHMFMEEPYGYDYINRIKSRPRRVSWLLDLNLPLKYLNNRN